MVADRRGHGGFGGAECKVDEVAGSGERFVCLASSVEGSCIALIATALDSMMSCNDISTSPLSSSKSLLMNTPSSCPPFIGRVSPPSPIRLMRSSRIFARSRSLRRSWGVSSSPSSAESEEKSRGSRTGSRIVRRASLTRRWRGERGEHCLEDGISRSDWIRRRSEASV